MNFAEVKALAFDLDGTLLAPGAVLSERTKKAIRACVDRGLKIIISTGRAAEAAEKFRLALDISGPMIYFNGAVVADMPRGDILNFCYLDKKTADICVDLSREYKCFCLVYLPGSEGIKKTRLVGEYDCPERDVYYKHTGLLAEIVDIKDELNRQVSLHGEASSCIKLMFLVEPDVQDIIRPKLEKLLGNSVYMTRTLYNFLEVMNANVSKGKGLSFVMDHLSLKKEEVIAFGDDENDIPMFSVAGFSAAPSNAKDSVKSRAGMVIGSNADDGVAKFLEELSLGKTP